ncbi:hypothetical protein DFJ74DRAFT_702019 [Hyaloraphidium curvatum]|nr:hypothetical protein DFJ74DRAFT_702019 [Hyaloraphidium curvatum]
MSALPSPFQLRMGLSGAAMFLAFGLVPSIPDVMYNKKAFPGTRHMLTLHLEATQNGMMLGLIALFEPWLGLGPRTTQVLEVASNVGAWFNVLPWLYGARTGAVVKLGEGQSAGNLGAPEPAENAKHASRMGAMLMACTLGDLVAWGIICYGLAKKGIEAGAFGRK